MIRVILAFVLIVVVAGGAPAADEKHPRPDDHQGHHRFEDAEKWARVFESEERDAWQKPEAVLDFLELRPYDIVADIGSATGYFPVRFARAVSDGKVYGIDIEPDMVRFLNERAEREGLGNLESILGGPDDPKLPGPTDLVFICNTYHHIEDRVAYFRRLVRRLARPRAEVVIVDFLPGDLPVGPPPAMKLSAEEVIEEFRRAGYRLDRQSRALPYQYMLAFVPRRRPVHRPSAENLEGRIEGLIDMLGEIPAGTRYTLESGEYELSSSYYVDSTCGNCEVQETCVDASVGLTISGIGIVVEGNGVEPGEVVLRTNAGYGILFENCESCTLRNLTVTGGVRDRDARATDGAVVVKNSSVQIENCVVRDNIGDSAIVAETVVGIAGIVGREGARLEIAGNRIMRNSWDGIALYRGAEATIERNRIDGVDKASGMKIGGGRGVAVGVTWDAKATLHRNWMTRYWKGLGIFVDAEVEATENVVEEILTWGIAYWDAGRGRPVARIERNIIFDCGACGISITRAEAGDPAPGQCRENLIVQTGQNPKYDDPDLYCIQCPIAVHAAPAGFEIGSNWLVRNRRAKDTSCESDLPLDVMLPGSSVPAGDLLFDLSHVASLRRARFFREWAGAPEGGNRAPLLERAASSLASPPDSMSEQTPDGID
jgi:SAM-dependent methyltransferase